MERRLLGPVLAGALSVALVSCSGGDDAEAGTTTSTSPPEVSSTGTTSTTPTPPERPTSTTTTSFAPNTVEGQVEAAYLRSWDVYADAVYNLELDEAALQAVFAGDYLTLVIEDIQDRIENGRPAHVVVEHGYSMSRVDQTTTLLLDQYRNHTVLIDPASAEPIEDDPNELLRDAVTLELISGSWRVTRVEAL